jgi:hypothetical protein
MGYLFTNSQIQILYIQASENDHPTHANDAEGGRRSSWPWIPMKGNTFYGIYAVADSYIRIYYIQGS